MINNAFNQDQIELQKLEQLRGIHYQLSRVADILAHEFKYPADIDFNENARQLAAWRGQRRQ